MHVIVPFAAPLPDAGRAALAGVACPALVRELAGCAATDWRDAAADEWSLSTPAERVLADALGWAVADGLVPLAVLGAAADGVPGAAAALDAAPAAAARPGWGLLTPAHWHVGTDQLGMGDPAALQLDEAASRELHALVAPLYTSEGYAVHWGAPLRWYLEHPSLASIPSASLQRVVGRNVDAWLGGGPALRLVRRLQNEVQMLLHEHPTNQARESRGQPPVNSVWLSGTGTTQPARGPRPRVDERLAAPAQAEDWPAWASAWQALAADLAALPWTALTLCGERAARTWRRDAAVPWWKAAVSRWRGAGLADLLEGL